MCPLAQEWLRRSYDGASTASLASPSSRAFLAYLAVAETLSLSPRNGAPSAPSTFLMSCRSKCRKTLAPSLLPSSFLLLYDTELVPESHYSGRPSGQALWTNLGAAVNRLTFDLMSVRRSGRMVISHASEEDTGTVDIRACVCYSHQMFTR